MTDTMIAKAARAACCPNGCVYAAMDDAAGCVAGVDFIRIARAVLTAIRTPDEAMCEKGEFWSRKAEYIWQDMIDAILAEEPKP